MPQKIVNYELAVSALQRFGRQVARRFPHLRVAGLEQDHNAPRSTTQFRIIFRPVTEDHWQMRCRLENSARYGWRMRYHTPAIGRGMQIAYRLDDPDELERFCTTVDKLMELIQEQSCRLN